MYIVANGTQLCTPPRRLAGPAMLTCAVLAIAACTESQPTGPTRTHAAVTAPADWPNEPPGATLITDQPFDARNSAGWVYDSGSAGSPWIVADPSAPLSPGNVVEFPLDIGFPAGYSPGSESYALTGLKRLYVGMWWKASNPWQGPPAGTTVLQYIHADTSGLLEYSVPPGTVGWGSIELIEQDIGNVQNNLLENNVSWDDQGFLVSGNRYAMTANLYNSNNPWPVGTANGNVVRYSAFPTNQLLLLVARHEPALNEPYTLQQAESTFPGWANNMQTDPQFVDEAAGNVQLRSGSPAIDAGISVPGVPYCGTAPDLGAHERC